MFSQCKNQDLPEPEFLENKDGVGDFKVTFYKDIYTEENLSKMGLNERQIKAIKYVKERGKITNTEYQEISDVSKPTVTRDFNILINKSILQKKGRTGKGTYYILKRAHKGFKGLTLGS